MANDAKKKLNEAPGDQPDANNNKKTLEQKPEEKKDDSDDSDNDVILVEETDEEIFIDDDDDDNEDDGDYTSGDEYFDMDNCSQPFWADDYSSDASFVFSDNNK